MIKEECIECSCVGIFIIKFFGFQAFQILEEFFNSDFENKYIFLSSRSSYEKGFAEEITHFLSNFRYFIL